MEFLYKNYIINYDLRGQGSYLILMHGWGVDKTTFSKVEEELKNYYTVLTFDFIGFGKSSTPIKPFSLDDYLESVEALVKHLNIVNPIVVGHSFGGRVAIKYALRNDVKKLILVSSAGIIHFSLKTKLKIIKYKFLKNIYKLFSKTKYQKLITSSGSDDYKKLNNVMKRTMTNVIKKDLKKYIKKINVSTLILWGYFDITTPYKDAIYFNKKIKDSRLITFFRSGHFCYLEEENKFINILIGGGEEIDW